MQLEIWHGLRQKVGHLGAAQPDFNLMGQVSAVDDLAQLTYSLNGGPEIELSVGRGPYGFGDGHRLARNGHFNADITIEDLHLGDNEIAISATAANGHLDTQTLIVERLEGDSTRPLSIVWNEIENPQDVGQYIDGHWAKGPYGLRTQHTGYDRIFLLGNAHWRDYEITVPITIHAIDPLTGPTSGDNGLGILLRFAGHITGGHRNFPAGQPKWGYQPFGAIAWLRWTIGPDMPPQKQFYRGDNDEYINHGDFYIEEGKTYTFKVACQTLTDSASGPHTTRYRSKIWCTDQREPDRWDWQVEQTSEHALRKGGPVLLAHHVNASFGDVEIIDLT
ncbi:MAG: hypothetical protein ACI906_003403 [Candidatus Latescibacterota bacterium]|jgi:hypothetical protein